MIGRTMRVRQHVASASGPASFAALRDAVCRGREPPPAHVVARLQSYRWSAATQVPSIAAAAQGAVAAENET